MLTREVAEGKARRQNELNNDKKFVMMRNDLKEAFVLYSFWDEAVTKTKNNMKLKKDGSGQKIAANQVPQFQVSSLMNGARKCRLNQAVSEKAAYKKLIEIMCDGNEQKKMELIDEMAALHPELGFNEDTLAVYGGNPVWKRWAANVFGVGPICFAALYGFLHPEEVPYASNLVSYCGLTADSKRVKGDKVKYNPTLRSKMLGAIAPSILKPRVSTDKTTGEKIEKISPYAIIYWRSLNNILERTLREIAAGQRNKYGEKDPNKLPAMSVIHAMKMATRIMIKYLLIDFYDAFCYIYNIPVAVPYLVEKKGLIHAGNSLTDFRTYLDLSPKQVKEVTMGFVPSYKAEKARYAALKVQFSDGSTEPEDSDESEDDVD